MHSQANLLSWAIAFSHGLEAAIPMKQLEDGHEFLKLQHGASFVGLQHELEGPYTCAGVLHICWATL